MYRSKHSRKTVSKRKIALIISIILILAVTAGSTLAYLIVETPSVLNIFTPSQVTTAVIEDFDGDMASGVKIANTDNTQAYIRAAVVVTWQDPLGNVHSAAPAEGSDYSMNWVGITDGSWIKGSDGYYYHKAPVDPEGSTVDTTSVLFSDFSQITSDAPEGFSLNVEVLGSGIQSTPTYVVEDEWGVTLDTDAMISGK